MGKKLRYRATSTLDILLIAGILILINIYSLGSFQRLDLTENREYTVADATKIILSQLDDIVNVKVFMTENPPPQIIQLAREVKDMLNEFEMYANPNFRLSYVDPKGDDSLIQEAQMAGIPEISLTVVEKDRRSVENIFFGIKVEHANRMESIEFISPETLEYELMTRIVKVLEKEAMMPTFGVLQGHGEPGTQPGNIQQGRDPDPMALFVEALRRKFKVFDVNLSDRDRIPDSVDTLLVVNPHFIPDYHLWAIDQFVMNGGKLLCMIDGVKYDMMQQQASPESFDSGIAGLLEHYGVRVNNDYVLDNHNVNIRYQTGPMSVRTADYPLWIKIRRTNFHPDHPITSQLNSATFQWASSIDFVDTNSGRVEKIELVRSSDEAWIMDKEFDVNPNQDFNVIPTGEQYNLGVLLSGVFSSYFADKEPPINPNTGEPVGGDNLPRDTSRETEIIVFSTSRLALNESWTHGRGLTENQNLILNAADFITRSDQLIGIRSRKATNRPIDPEIMNDETRRNIYRWVNILGVPFLVIAFGIFMSMLKIGRKKRFERELKLRQ